MDNEFYISKKDWDKIISYAGIAYDEFNAEIGGMAVVIQDKDNDWTIKDPVILDQVITAGNTHLNKESLAPYYTKMAKKYSKKNFRFCWWHSHHTMQAFWSGTDLATIDEFQDGDFSFALVVNLKGIIKLHQNNLCLYGVDINQFLLMLIHLLILKVMIILKRIY